MSSVRMCDKCGTVFSERSDGWSTFEGSIRRRNPQTGKTETIQDDLDQCPDCTELSMMPQRPELTTTVTDPRQPTTKPYYEHDAGP